MPDFVTARNEICELFDAHWHSYAGGVVGYVPRVYYPRVIDPTPIRPDRHWLRLSVQSIMSRQTAFSGRINGAVRYEDSGLVFVQLFAPRNVIEAAEEQDRLANIARNAFRKRMTESRVWFRQARINDLPAEDEMLRLNVVADYYYDEVI